jgi:hypothetical protein
MQAVRENDRRTVAGHFVGNAHRLALNVSHLITFPSRSAPATDLWSHWVLAAASACRVATSRHPSRPTPLR